MDILTCLIVDDEPIAVDGIKFYLQKLDGVMVAGHCYSALEALGKIKENPVDLLFLDINMPDLSGLELLECLENPPMAILTTAYSEYAMEGYRLDVVDYLLKPISAALLVRAVDKARARKRQLTQSEVCPGELYVKQDDSYVRIAYHDILFVESMQNYVKIYTVKATYMAHQTLSSVCERLAGKHFYQIHKSFLINTMYIDRIKGNRVLIAGHELPLSKHRKDDFFKAIINV